MICNHETGGEVLDGEVTDRSDNGCQEQNGKEAATDLEAELQVDQRLYNLFHTIPAWLYYSVSLLQVSREAMNFA